MKPSLHIYADESSTTEHQHMVIGAIAVEANALADIVKCLEQARIRGRVSKGELKWRKVSRAVYQGYAAFLDEYFRLSGEDSLHFHALHVDASTIRHSEYSGGDHELGFNKLVYQLLLHRVGRRYGEHYKIEAYLDERTHLRDPDEMTSMLNSDVLKRWGYEAPFQFVRYKASHESQLLQACDLIIGAIGYRKNLRHKKPDASPPKCRLAVYIGRSAVQLERHDISSARARRFTLWDFRYKAR